jgi:hypothetical protein
MAHPGNAPVCHMPADLSYQAQAPLVKLGKALRISRVKLGAAAEAPFTGDTGGSVLKLKKRMNHFLLNHHNVYHSSTTDLGWFLIGWTVYTFIMWIPAMRIHGAMAITFTLLLIGFILLDLAHFGYPELTKVAGYELMLCAASALYMMAHVIYAQVLGRNILPVGKPWLK